MRWLIALALLYGIVSGLSGFVTAHFFPADALFWGPLSLLAAPFAACSLNHKTGKGVPALLLGATLGGTVGYSMFLLVSFGVMPDAAPQSRLPANPFLCFEFIGPAIVLCGFAGRQCGEFRRVNG